MFEVDGFWYDGRFFPVIAGGSGEDDPPPADDDADDDDGEEGDDGADGDDDKGGKDGKDANNVTLSRETLKKRLQRADKRAAEKLAKANGFSNAAEMEEVLKAVKTSKETEKGEAAEAKRQLRELKTQNETLQNRLKGESLQRHVERLASRMGFIDPEDAYVVGKFATQTDEYVDDDGEIDEDAINEKLEDIKTKKKHLVRARKSADDEDEEDGDDDNDSDNSRRSNSSRSTGSDRNRKAPNPTRRNGKSRKPTPEEEAEFARRYPLAAGKIDPRFRGF